jgi:hypothetical protein
LPPAILTAMSALAFGPGGWRTRIGRSGILLIVTFLTLLPWAARNWVRFGEPVWTTTHGGYTLALANNPVYYADVLDGPPGAVWTGPNQAAWMAEIGRKTQDMSEPEADRFLRLEALRMLTERPGDFGRASIERFKRFWGLAPSGLVYPWWLRAITVVWTAPLWLALVLGLFRGDCWRWPGVAGPSIILALTLVHLVYWTDMRMRAPLTPAIALIVAGLWWGGSASMPSTAPFHPSKSLKQDSGQ